MVCWSPGQSPGQTEFRHQSAPLLTSKAAGAPKICPDVGHKVGPPFFSILFNEQNSVCYAV